MRHQARTRGGGGGGGGGLGFLLNPLLKSSIHMNLYCVYVGHTHLIESSTHFRKKEPLCLKLSMGLDTTQSSKF